MIDTKLFISSIVNSLALANNSNPDVKCKLWIEVKRLMITKKNSVCRYITEGN